MNFFYPAADMSNCSVDYETVGDRMKSVPEIISQTMDTGNNLNLRSFHVNNKTGLEIYLQTKGLHCHSG